MSAWFAEVQQKFIADFIEKDRWTYITDGLKITIIVTLLALIVGLILGILIAMVRYPRPDPPEVVPFARQLSAEAG